jgi:hypothetical protein
MLDASALSGVNSLVGFTGILSFVIAVGVLLGTAWRVGKNTQTVNNYRESALSWETKARAQESELSDVRDQLGDAINQLQEMQGKVHVLEEVASGRAALEAMATQITTLVSSQLVGKEEFVKWQSESRSYMEKVLVALQRGSS